MRRSVLLVFVFVLLALVTVIWREHHARATMQERLHLMHVQAEDLAWQVATLQQQQQRLVASPRTTAPNQDDTAQLAELRREVAQLRETLMQVERASAAISNEVAMARGANIPFVYPDCTKRADYAFTGYSTPQSSLQSVLWAIRQTDAKMFLQSLTGTVAEVFAKQFEDLPDGVMPGGFRNGAMFKATGFRVVEETPISDDEMRLKVFLEGSRIMIQPVFKRDGTEWKWARNEN